MEIAFRIHDQGLEKGERIALEAQANALLARLGPYVKLAIVRLRGRSDFFGRPEAWCRLDFILSSGKPLQVEGCAPSLREALAKIAALGTETAARVLGVRLATS